ncbi:MAG: hypothetical protein V4666_05465 [Bacteroidota bacterium]
MDIEINQIFSDEYSTESTETNGGGMDVLENTEFSADEENYTITKPKRIIIKATITK